MNAIILAAGTGSRLVNLTRELPKALVEVHGRPLIDYTLAFVESLHCEQIDVVGGFYFEKLQHHLKQFGKATRLFENTEFLKGSILSLLSALPSQNGSFLLLNVDHIYPLRLGSAFLKKREKLKQITAFVDLDRPLHEDDMKVALTQDQRLQRISKTLQEFNAGYIGMTYVPQEKLAVYKNAASTLAERNKDAVVENLLQWLIENNQAPEIFDASGIRWLEVDNQWDLRDAERILSQVKNYLA